MRAHVKKWGNSASVRIPAAVMAAADLSLDQEVDVREEDGRVVIAPVAVPRHALDALLDAMVPASFPDEVDSGPPVGAEVW